MLQCFAKAFIFSFLSSARVIDMATEFRTKPKILICCDGMSDDFFTLITNPKLVNKVCVAEILATSHKCTQHSGGHSVLMLNRLNLTAY